MTYSRIKWGDINVLKEIMPIHIDFNCPADKAGPLTSSFCGLLLGKIYHYHLPVIDDKELGKIIVQLKFVLDQATHAHIL